jgi:hypothetical protein
VNGEWSMVKQGRLFIRSVSILSKQQIPYEICFEIKSVTAFTASLPDCTWQIGFWFGSDEVGIQKMQ